MLKYLVPKVARTESDRLDSYLEHGYSRQQCEALGRFLLTLVKLDHNAKRTVDPIETNGVRSYAFSYFAPSVIVQAFDDGLSPEALRSFAQAGKPVV